MQEFVQHRKQLEDKAQPILLMGSRAFSSDFNFSDKDWDLVVPHQTLITLIKRKIG